MKKGTTGGSLGGRVVENPARTARRRKRAKRQEDDWAAKAGEVKVTYACICPAPGCKSDNHTGNVS